jgi:heptosyltransferase-2
LFVDSNRPLLAVRLPNWVGDVVMALPTIVQLQRAGFVLRALGRSWAKDLLAGLNMPVTSVPRGIVAASRAHRTLQMDHGLLFTNSISTAMAMRLAGIRAVGYRAYLRGPLLYAGLVKNPGLHEVEYFWRLGAAAATCWGSPEIAWPASPPPQLDLPLSNAHRVAAAKALATARVRGPYVVCCPMSAQNKRGFSKRWPHFAEFNRELQRLGHTLVACPGPGEEAQCEMLMPKQTAIIRGLSLGVYGAVLAGASAVVANDSGPMHLATAVGAPVLGIFGRSDPARTRPWGGRFLGDEQGWPEIDAVLATFEEMTHTTSEPAVAGRVGASILAPDVTRRAA